MLGINETAQKEFIRLAIEQAQTAVTRGDAPFGGVLVDYRGEVALVHSNTTYSSGMDNFLAHVEINLIRHMAQKFNVRRLDNFSLFLNAAPCPVCTIAMIDRGVRDFYYGARQEAHTYPDLTIEEIERRVPYKINLNGGILEKECRRQIVEGRKQQLKFKMSS